MDFQVDYVREEFFINKLVTVWLSRPPSRSRTWGCS
jgi:hypothetical protein